MTGVTLSGDQFILFVLLLKMGIMAALAGALITSSFFKRLIFLDTRNTRQNWQFAVVFGLILTAGSSVRVLVGYEGMDVSLSGTFLVGLLGGMVPGSAVGFFVGLPALLRGEWATLPFLVLCGLGGGIIRARTRDRDEFWGVSPIFLNNIARSWRVFAAERRIDARAAIMLTLVALEAARTLAGDRAPSALFVFHPDHFWVTLCVWLTTLVCVGIPLKIWNNTRVEALLEEQRSAAAQARFDALRSQINPHFFFNVLNAATSLIWSEPEKARWILVKLSSILRRLLRGGEDFVPLEPRGRVRRGLSQPRSGALRSREAQRWKRSSTEGARRSRAVDGAPAARRKRRAARHLAEGRGGRRADRGFEGRRDAARRREG